MDVHGTKLAGTLFTGATEQLNESEEFLSDQVMQRVLQGEPVADTVC